MHVCVFVYGRQKLALSTNYRTPWPLSVITLNIFPWIWRPHFFRYLSLCLQQFHQDLSQSVGPCAHKRPRQQILQTHPGVRPDFKP